VLVRYQVHAPEGFAGTSVSAAVRNRLLLGGVAALALLALFFRGVDWRALQGAFGSADPRFLGLVVLATVVAYAVRAWRWGFLLAPLARVPFGRLFTATWVGFMAGLLVPRAGEVIRPYLVARRYGMSTAAAFASIVIERLVDVVSVVALFGLYLYVLPMPAAQSRGSLLNALKLGGALAGLAALGLMLLLLALHLHAERAMAFADRLLGRFPERIGRVVGGALRSFSQGLVVLQAPAPLLLAIFGQSLLLWMAIALGIYFNNLAFGLELPFHSAFLVIVFLTVGVAIPTPGTIGGFHEFYRLAMTQAFGVDPATAAAAGIASHALTNLPVLILGLLFLAGEGLSLAGVARLSEHASSEQEPSGAVKGAVRRGDEL
jgi:glycosyltransferase 2 family protein